LWVVITCDDSKGYPGFQDADGENGFKGDREQLCRAICDTRSNGDGCSRWRLDKWERDGFEISAKTPERLGDRETKEEEEFNRRPPRVRSRRRALEKGGEECWHMPSELVHF